MINRRHKCIFVHIPKNGGTSIKKLLDITSDKKYYHRPATKLKEIYKKEWGDYFKFGVVRNPWDRVVSIYNYYKFNKKCGIKNIDYDFDVFCDKLCNSPERWMAGDYSHEIRSFQYNWLFDRDKQLVDKIIRFENYKEEVKSLIHRFKLKKEVPHERVSNQKEKHYSIMYKDETKKMIEERFSLDIKKFNYKFETL
jgi:chondroitin 4-sulfotransferase 11